MENKRLKQVHMTLAFLRSVISSGESMTDEVRSAINESIDNLKNLDAEIKKIKLNRMGSEDFKKFINDRPSIDISSFAKESGVNRKTISHIAAGIRKGRASTMGKLEKTARKYGYRNYLIHPNL